MIWQAKSIAMNLKLSHLVATNADDGAAFLILLRAIAIGAVYLGVIAISYPLTAITNAYVAILRSMNYVMFPVIITTFAIGVNVTLNYILIFGKFGFPVMGVAGAALATVIARAVECGILLIAIHMHKVGDDGIGDFVHTKYDKLKEKGTSFFNKTFVSKFFTTASPVIANEFMWGLGVTMYSLVYGRMGVDAIVKCPFCLLIHFVEHEKNCSLLVIIML